MNHTTYNSHHFFKCHHYCHHSVTLPSHGLHNLLAQLLLHQNSHTSCTITIPRPSQHISPTLHIHKMCSLSSPPHFLQSTHIHPPLPQLLTHLRTSPTHTPYIPSTFQVPTLTRSRLSGFPSFCKQCTNSLYRLINNN